ncbi:MAG: alpha/beta hydrolase [Clostridiales bacterium]|jgi:pimeloyl-ACP methyl ester carboxylesterase|nr:alpha/beta hydrolase [Clostridiales bacterium]
MKAMKDIPYRNTDDPSHRLDVYSPDEPAEGIIIYFYGGGFESGSKEDLSFMNVLAERGYTLALPNYRLYPNARYPDYIEDAASAVAWVVKRRKEFSESGKVILGGISAGAYLAMMLCFEKRWLGEHAIDPESFAGFIFDAGQPTLHFNILKEDGLPPTAVVVDERAPLFHVREGRICQPMLFICADDDIPGRYEQTLLMMATLKAIGCEDCVSFRYKRGFGHCAYVIEPDYLKDVENFARNLKLD